jgi:hypothetical protein
MLMPFKTSYIYANCFPRIIIYPSKGDNGCIPFNVECLSLHIFKPLKNEGHNLFLQSSNKSKNKNKNGTIKFDGTKKL